MAMSKEERRARRKERRALRKAKEMNQSITTNNYKVNVDQKYINSEDTFTVSVEGYTKTKTIQRGTKKNKKWSILGEGLEHINKYDKRHAVQMAVQIITGKSEEIEEIL